MALLPDVDRADRCSAWMFWTWMAITFGGLAAMFAIAIGGQ